MKRRSEIRLLPRAERELQALPAGIRERIVAKLELLYDFPELGPAMVDAFSGYRALLAAGNCYRVVYRIRSPSLIEVAYVRHCSRQLGLRLVRAKE